MEAAAINIQYMRGKGIAFVEILQIRRDIIKALRPEKIPVPRGKRAVFGPQIPPQPGMGGPGLELKIPSPALGTETAHDRDRFHQGGFAAAVFPHEEGNLFVELEGVQAAQGWNREGVPGKIRYLLPLEPYGSEERPYPHDVLPLFAVLLWRDSVSGCGPRADPLFLLAFPILDEILDEHLHHGHERHAEENPPEAKEAAADGDGQQHIDRLDSHRIADNPGLDDVAVDLLHGKNVDRDENRSVDVAGEQRHQHADHPADDRPEIGDHVHDAEHHARAQARWAAWR